MLTLPPYSVAEHGLSSAVVRILDYRENELIVRLDMSTEMRTAPNNMVQDEISLIDLALVIARRKWILVSSTIFGLLVAIGYSLMQSDSYSYTTAIDAGVMEVADNLRSIDSPDDLIAKIEQAYIPSLVASGLTIANNLRASSPKHSSIITLTSTSKVSGQVEVYSQLHRNLLELIQKDQTVILSALGAKHFIHTRIMSPTMEGKVRSKASNTKLMSVLGLIFGTMFGLLMVFIAEFIVNARQEWTKVKAGR